MTEFGKHLFEMGVSLVRAQAAQDRSEFTPQDPSTLFTCKNCGKPSLGTGWFPFCSIWCSAEFKDANQL